MTEWIDVISVKDFPKKGPHTLVLKGHPIAIYYYENCYFAIEDCCTHQGLPLSDGLLQGDIITCPYHGAKFSIMTGEVKAPPAFDNLPVFEVRIINGIIQVQL